MARNKRAFIEAYLGTIDTGKTTRVRERLAQLKPPRVLVWDWKREWSAPVKVSTVGELLAALKAKGKSRFYIAFHPSFDDKVRAKQFDAVCRAVLALGNVLFLVEELQFVTRPSYAPGPWKMLTTSGREWSIRLMGTSQRPALVDKNFLGNATRVHTRRLGYQADRVTLAQELGVTVDEVAALTGHGYLEKDRVTGKMTRKKS